MQDFQAAFASMPIVGILRGIGRTAVLPATAAAYEAGVKFIEIALNTPDALELIAMVAGNKPPDTYIGAGTVLDAASCEKAVEAGAQFIVTPVMQKEVMDVCKKRSIPVFPGALTPSEVHAAWKAGAFMVKVFPAGSMGGPSYIKELRGPFDSIPLLACGGVTPENLPDYLRAGANGIAIGGTIFKAEWIASRAFQKIQEKAREFIGCLGKR